ncbi:MAG: transcription-repair coupling factor, partial [Alphaproteobacteria bacterium]|nr:transcription-repair coupling factor [Alphaproteobacteria bacterium]
MKNISGEFSGEVAVSGAPGAVDAFWLAERFRDATLESLVHVAVDDRALDRMAEALRVLAPGIELLLYPAWDCLPYDRVGPNGGIAARRIDTLWTLARRLGGKDPAPRSPFAVLTTINAVVQKVPAPSTFKEAALAIRPGAGFDRDAFLGFAARNGYSRTETVMEPGEFAIRGGIVDIFPTGLQEPVRLDLFGEVVEKIRRFDPLTQMTMRDGDGKGEGAGEGKGEGDGVILKPVSEVLLTDDSINRFRSGYRELFGAAREGDLLYRSVT